LGEILAFVPLVVSAASPADPIHRHRYNLIKDHAMSEKSDNGDEILGFIEQYEQLEAEKKDASERQKDVMSEAKARGYDTKILKKIIALRKRDPDDISEEDAVLRLYAEAIGLSI
jgi:uncharacterized protein (UPF0335 family)